MILIQIDLSIRISLGLFLVKLTKHDDLSLYCSIVLWTVCKVLTAKELDRIRTIGTLLLLYYDLCDRFV